MKYIARTIREDGHKASCIIDLPDDYNEVSNSGNDKYDELVEEQVSDRIFFEGLGFGYEEITPYENATKIVCAKMRTIKITMFDNYVNIFAESDTGTHEIRCMPHNQFRNMEKNQGLVSHFFPESKEVE